MAKNNKKTTDADAPLGIEARLFAAADKLRENLEPSEYKHIALGLVFLRHISHAFEELHARLAAEGEDPEDRDWYLAENVFWVPKEARWSELKANARQPDIGGRIDKAMEAIERENDALENVLVKNFNRESINPDRLGELIDLFSNDDLAPETGAARDVLGRVYEYFIAGFAGAEGRRGGEFYTPRSVVRLLVEMLQPFPDPARGIAGRVYDPCCGSGGMFVQAEKFLEAHGGRVGDLAVYGQESNFTTWRLCKMNLAVRGIDTGGVKWNNAGTFVDDEWPDKQFDFVLANPPFNVSDWQGESLKGDARWKYGAPPASNANYAWLQHIAARLSPAGTAGVVLANGSMSTMQSGENEIRKNMIEAGLVDCMVALPGQLFYSTQIPACLWFLARDRAPKDRRDRSGEILFIDARKAGKLVDRTRRELGDDEIAEIARTYHAWQGRAEAGAYEDRPGFCKAATLDDARAHNYVLTPGRYVGAAEAETDDAPFAERFAELKSRLLEQMETGRSLEENIRAQLERIDLTGDNEA